MSESNKSFYTKKKIKSNSILCGGSSYKKPSWLTVRAAIIGELEYLLESVSWCTSLNETLCENMFHLELFTAYWTISGEQWT